MEPRPYHSYLFFGVEKSFYQRPASEQERHKKSLRDLLARHAELTITPYLTQGLTAGTTFMLWVWAEEPEAIQKLARDIMHTSFGQWLTLVHSYFGIVRPSTYSGRTGKSDQTIQNFADRLRYLVLYPFTKTTGWYQLDFEERRSIMGKHIKVGVSHAPIRQCLLYSYGVDDQEFLVSYEMDSLTAFQDLVIEMRSTASRIYTQNDTPIFTCTYKPLEAMLAWL